MKLATDAPLTYRLMQRTLWALARILLRIEVTGVENVPASGPLVIAPNHIHTFDVPIIGMVVPRRTAIFAADKWRGKLGGWVLERVTHVIYVARGEADRAALSQALIVLGQGHALAVAPEGTRSRTGGLQPGKHGVAYLASRTSAAILPVAVWGQETALRDWPRLRRPAVHVRIAPPIYPPPGAERARTAELHILTDELMLTLAAMMPPQYRGVYADRV